MLTCLSVSVVNERLVSDFCHRFPMETRVFNDLIFGGLLSHEQLILLNTLLKGPPNTVKIYSCRSVYSSSQISNIFIYKLQFKQPFMFAVILHCAAECYTCPVSDQIEQLKLDTLGAYH